VPEPSSSPFGVLIYPNNLKILVLSCCGKAIAASVATGLKALEAALALVALE